MTTVLQAEKSLVKLHDRSMPPPAPPKHPAGTKPPGLKLPASMGPPPPRQKHTNPFLAAPLWEEAARTAPAPESALQNNSSFPEQGTLQERRQQQLQQSQHVASSRQLPCILVRSCIIRCIHMP